LFSACKATHLCRTVLPPQFGLYSTSHDAAVRSCLSTVLQSAVADSAWDQAGLPLARGGLGLAHASNLSAATFLGSIQDAAATFVGLYAAASSMPPADPTVVLARDLLVAQLEDPAARESFPSLENLRSAAPSAQKRLSSLVHDVTLASLMRTDTRNAALRSLSASLMLSMADLRAPNGPSAHPGDGVPAGRALPFGYLRPLNGGHVSGVSWRPSGPVSRPFADLPWAWGQHHSAQPAGRHGPPPSGPRGLRAAHRGASSIGRYRPPAWRCPSDSDGLSLAIDVTVTSPVSTTALPRASLASGHAAAAAEL
jgi:hypothetical protein